MTDFPIAQYLRDESDVEFEYVSLGGMRKAGDPPRWFIADQRYYDWIDPQPHVCIHNWTSAPASLLRSLEYAARYPKPWSKIWVFEARNKGQIAAWLQEFGYNPQFMGRRPDYQPALERTIVNERERMIESAARTIERAQAKIDHLMSLPAEPTPDPDDPDQALVVWFNKQFNQGSRVYTYAAVRANDGLWYTTGPNTPKGYSWDELIDWFSKEPNQDATMWVARGWEPVL